MMAAAVSADGKNSSDSESEEEVLPEMSSEFHEEKAVCLDDEELKEADWKGRLIHANK